jgi:hypothetical protein
MPATALVSVQCWYAKNRDFVMSALTKNPRPKRSHSETRFESWLAIRMGITLPSAVRGGPD